MVRNSQSASGAPKPCLGCGELIYQGSRCTQCDNTQQAKRGTTTERGLGAHHQSIRKRVIERDGCCQQCGTTGTKDNPLTADHLVPRSKGGETSMENMVCLCRIHNSAKGAR